MVTGTAEKPTDVITALLSERRRYEQWLATLESRRAITPPHVYARVHGDYQARLSGVLDQLGGRSTELQQSVDLLGERLSALESEENQRRDERSEAELRAAVGEYSHEKWQELSDTTDAEITRLTAERSETTAELAQLQQLLNMAKSRRPEPLPPAVASTGAASASLPPALAPAPAANVSAGPPPMPAPELAPEAPRIRPPEPRTADGALKRPAAAAPKPEPRTDPRADPGAPKAEPTMFDELEFLKSVIDPRAEGQGTPAAKPAPERPRTPMAGVPAAARKFATPPEAGTLNDISLRDKRTDSTPRGDASVPVFLRDVPIEQVKSLKCSECGSMNYPTEWYCERCGGELAAM